MPRAGTNRLIDRTRPGQRVTPFVSCWAARSAAVRRAYEGDLSRCLTRALMLTGAASALRRVHATARRTSSHTRYTARELSVGGVGSCTHQPPVACLGSLRISDICGDAPHRLTGGLTQ